MVEPILIEALGVTIALNLDGLTDAEASTVAAAWRDARLDDARGSDAQAAVRVRDAGEEIDLARALERLSQRVTLEAIEARKGELWLLHAAGLATSDGRVIVLVGPSGRGKTTAARALAEHLAYVSDETVGIDERGGILPYRKPLSMIETPAAPKVQRAVSELVGSAVATPETLRLAAVVLLDRRADGPDEPTIDSVDLGDALEELVAQTSYLAAGDHPLARAARLVAPLGGVRRVTYREASSLAGIIESLLAPAHPAEGWRAAEVAPASAERAGYTRAPLRDAIVLDDPERLALLRDAPDGAAQVQLLAGIAPTLWAAADGRSRAELIDAAVAAHGEPETGDAADLVDAALAELVDAGVLLPPEAEPIWRIRDDVAWHDSGDRVVALSLADSSGARAVILEDSAALVWRALAVQDKETGARGLPRGEVAAAGVAIVDFVASLHAAGLVTTET